MNWNWGYSPFSPFLGHLVLRFQHQPEAQGHGVSAWEIHATGLQGNPSQDEWPVEVGRGSRGEMWGPEHGRSKCV